MLIEKDIALTVTEEVIEFVQSLINSLHLKDPVPALIYGKFGDEKEDNYRVSLSERSELQQHASGKGFIVKVRGINELFVPSELEPFISGKTMLLVEDAVEFK